MIFCSLEISRVQTDMFTGLIEEIGQIAAVQKQGGAVRFTISATEITQDLAVDDSISVNGVCLTAIRVSPQKFDVEAVEETLRKTTLGSFRTATKVNLERCLRLSDRLGGHIVQGHVDSVGEVISFREQQGGRLLTIRLPADRMRYIISEGSIAVNGVSLTVARIEDNRITISLIPHTLGKTTLGDLYAGDSVNIEVDLVGKYVENLLLKSTKNELTEVRLRELGF